MARVVEKFHSFTCTSMHSSTDGMNHTCLSLPSRSWSSFTHLGGWKTYLAQAPAWRVNSLLGTTKWRLSQLLAAQAVMPHWAIGTQRGFKLTTSWSTSRDATTEPPVHVWCSEYLSVLSVCPRTRHKLLTRNWSNFALDLWLQELFSYISSTGVKSWSVSRVYSRDSSPRFRKYILDCIPWTSADVNSLRPDQNL